MVPSNGICEVEQPKDFVRLWSCLQYIYASPPLEPKPEEIKEGAVKIVDMVF